MKNFRIAVMLNGAEGIDYFETLSNLKQIESGLISNKNQSILYYDLKTINESETFLWRLAKHFSGHSYAFFLDSVLKQVIRRILTAITNNHLSRDGTVNISLFGFSEGASLARHFGMEFIKKRLIDSMPPELKQYGIKVKLEAEYLLDSVHLSTPVTVSILKPFSLTNLYPRGYYRMDIPHGTKAYHAVSLDDVYSENQPVLLDKVTGQTEEVWFAGDHLGVGGGHWVPYANMPTVSDDALQYIVQRAKQNGFEFTQSFIETLEKQKRSQFVSAVHNKSRHDIPVKSREARRVVVKTKYGISDELPLVHESVIDRINRQNYSPIGLMPFHSVKLVKRNGAITTVRINSEDKFHHEPKSKAIKPATKVSHVKKHVVSQKKSRSALSSSYTPGFDKKTTVKAEDRKKCLSKQSNTTTLHIPSVGAKGKYLKQ